MTKDVSLTIGLAIVLASAVGAGAQNRATTPPRTAPSTVDTADRTSPVNQFFVKAAEGGRAEVAMAQLAQSRSQNDDVKAFAKMLEADHVKANTDLASAAKRKNVTLPADMSNEQREDLAKLEKLQGAAFDRAYIDLMVSDHTKDVKEFEEAANSADADVKAFATNTLPALHRHLLAAQDLKKKK